MGGLLHWGKKCDFSSKQISDGCVFFVNTIKAFSKSEVQAEPLIIPSGHLGGSGANQEKCSPSRERAAKSLALLTPERSLTPRQQTPHGTPFLLRRFSHIVATFQSVCYLPHSSLPRRLRQGERPRPDENRLLWDQG